MSNVKAQMYIDLQRFTLRGTFSHSLILFGIILFCQMLFKEHDSISDYSEFLSLLPVLLGDSYTDFYISK